jgi:hypothetical protein
VSGHIKVPKVDCTAAEVSQTNDVTVFWVGLDGALNNTVEQDGIGVTCVNLAGGGIGPKYLTWWEMYPFNTDQFLNMPIYAGDDISMKVNYANSTYSFTISDLTKKTTETASSQCNSGYICANSSAEWIAERAGDGSGYSYLIDWHSVTFNDDMTNSITDPANKMFPITSYSNTPVDMYNKYGSGNLLAQVPSTLSKKDSFPDKWLATQ